MFPKGPNLEGRADEEELTAEELEPLRKVGNAVSEVASMLLAVRTVGDLRRSEARFEEIDTELENS